VAALTEAAGGRVCVAPGTEGRRDYQAARQLTLGGVAAIPLSAFVGADAADAASCLVGAPRGGAAAAAAAPVPVPIRFAFCHPDEVLAEAGRRLAVGAAVGWRLEGGMWGKAPGGS